MLAYSKPAIWIAVLTCLTPAAMADDLNHDGHRQTPDEAREMVSYTDDMRWPTHGLVPAQTDETRPATDATDCWD